MSTRLHTGLSSLPTELWVKILEHLSYDDLKTCQQVSKFLEDLIASTASLLYNLELAIAGLQDNPACPLTTQEKRSLLREHRDVIDILDEYTLENDARPVLYVAAARPRRLEWRLAGGVLAQMINNYTFKFTQFPLKTFGIPFKEWTIGVQCDVSGFAFDPGQDLLVLLTRMDVLGVLIDLQILNMSSGWAHPQSRGTISTNGVVVHGRTMVLGGDYICLEGSFYGDIPSAKAFRVWNWKTGEVIFSYDYMVQISVGFLDNRHLILAEIKRVDCPPRLGIFYMTSSRTETYIALIDLVDQTRRATFQLPPRGPHIEIHHLTVLCEPMATWNTHLSSTSPFLPLPSDQNVVVFRFNLWHVGNLALHSNAIICTLVSTLLDTLKRPARVTNQLEYTDKPLFHETEIPWRDWGILYSRAEVPFKRSDPFAMGDTYRFSYVSGSRFILHDGQAAIIYDFNQTKFQHMLASPPPHEYRISLSPFSTTLEGMRWDIEVPVETHLPYRKYVVNIPLMRNRLQTVLLNGNSVIFVPQLRINGAYFRIFSP